MTSRRNFVTSGFWLAAGSLTPPALLASISATDLSASLPTPELFIYDLRFPQAAVAAAKATANGIDVALSAGELTQLWTERLQPAWKLRPMTLAGLTTRSDLFVLETLAGDHRMKLLFSKHDEATGAYEWLLVPRSSQV